MGKVIKKWLTRLPWMLRKIELLTQPRVSVHAEKSFKASTSSSTNTTVGLKTKKLMSKFLLLKGTKHAIFLFCSVSCFCISINELNGAREEKKQLDSWTFYVNFLGHPWPLEFLVIIKDLNYKNLERFWNQTIHVVSPEFWPFLDRIRIAANLQNVRWRKYYAGLKNW